MATGEFLLNSLRGLNFSPLENPFGEGASILATSLPKIINPAGSVGTNLAVALGGTILSALLGYQARNQANELTQQTNRYGLQMLGLPSATDRLNMIQNIPDTFYGEDIKARLADLSTSLEYQNRQADYLAELEKKKQMAQLEAQTSDLGEKYIGMQTDKLLAGITARGVEARSLEAYRQANREAFEQTRQRNEKAMAELRIGLETEQKLKLMNVRGEQNEKLQQVRKKNLEDLARLKADLATEQMLKGIAARGEQQQNLEETRQANRIELNQIRDQQETARIKLRDQLKGLAGDRLSDKQREKISDDTVTAQAFYDLANELETDPQARLKLSAFWEMNPIASNFYQLKNEYQKKFNGVAVNATEEERSNIAFGFSNFSTAEDIATALRQMADKMVTGIKTQAAMPQTMPEVLKSLNEWQATNGRVKINDVFSQSGLTDDQKASLLAERDNLIAEFQAAGEIPTPEMKARAVKLKAQLQMYGLPLE